MLIARIARQWTRLAFAYKLIDAGFAAQGTDGSDHTAIILLTSGIIATVFECFQWKREGGKRKKTVIV